LDIPIGNYKIQHGKGPRIHYGVNSVEEKLGKEDFWRVRVGVENREIRGNTGVPGEVYSLQDFNQEEKKIIEDVVVKIVDDLVRVVS
jgi:peptidyl-tRNA hydrolase